MNEHAARRAAHLSARTAMQTMQTTGILQQYTDRGQAHYSDPSNSGTTTTQKNCSLSPIGGRKKDTNGRVEFPSPQYIYVYDDSWEGVEMAVTDSIYSSSIYAPPPPRLFHAHHSTEHATLGGGAQCSVEPDFDAGLANITMTGIGGDLAKDTRGRELSRRFLEIRSPKRYIRISAIASEKTGVRFGVDASKHRDLVIPEEVLTPDRQGSPITVRQLSVTQLKLYSIRQLAPQNLITALSQSMKWMYGEGSNSLTAVALELQSGHAAKI
ncbi:hypothetical protein EDD17DRAFT_1513446 [Pisolithus thermaeus]|nr:hypothetical protein EDD17DRAFT_1513446 [Pisolithus thermaeus]